MLHYHKTRYLITKKNNNNTENTFKNVYES